MEVRWAVSRFRQWLRVRGKRWVGGRAVRACVTATDRIYQTKLGLYCHKYRGNGEGGGSEGGRQSGRKRR